MKKFCLLVAAILSACSNEPSANANANANDEASTTQPKYTPIGEYKGVKLGSSFEDIIGSVDSDLFNPYGLKECFRDIALRGCGLSRKSDDTMFDMKGGVPYTLKLSFNRNDKLTDIGLNYHREERISGKQCRDIFARTVDWVALDYGPLTYHRTGEKAEAKGEKDNIEAKTPAGNIYAFLKPDREGSYVTQFMHLTSEKVNRKAVGGKTEVATTNRGISLFSSFIVVDGKPICDVDLEFREPDTVERLIYEANP